MEIADGSYKKLLNPYYKRHEIDAPQIVFQQKGLNNYKSNAFKNMEELYIVQFQIIETITNH